MATDNTGTTSDVAAFYFLDNEDDEDNDNDNDEGEKDDNVEKSDDGKNPMGSVDAVEDQDSPTAHPSSLYPSFSASAVLAGDITRLSSHFQQR